MNELEQKIYNAVVNIVEKLGYELVEVKYEISDEINLTLVIFKNDGITFDDCKLVTESVNDVLDDINPTNDKPYNLNVSSLGLDRPIKTKRDYERYLNKKIELTLKNKQKVVGTVVLVNDSLTLNVKGVDKIYNYNDIDLAKAYIKF